MKKELGHSVVCPFQNYIDEKRKFREAHPKAAIIEEIKTLFLAVANVPHLPGLQMQAGPQQVLMIAWAVVFREDVSEVTMPIEAAPDSKIILTSK